MNRRIIIDTSFLLCFFYADLLKFIHLVFDEILVPVEVEKEFFCMEDMSISLEEQVRRFVTLHQLYDEEILLRCPNTDRQIDIILSKKSYLGRGEIAAISQNMVLEQKYALILDDKKARREAQRYSLSIQGTLYVLALMDLQFKVCKYDKVLELLREKLNFRFSKKIAQEAYKKAMRDLNL